jgi:hypothetical protein
MNNLLLFQTVFDELPQKEMEEARARSNVYEIIGQSIFLNRYINRHLSYKSSYFQ